jgi:hypothetical protein
VAMRRAQRRSGCSTKTLNIVLEMLTFYGHLRVKKKRPWRVNRKRITKKMAQHSGAVIIQLHGCAGVDCTGHIYMPDDPSLFCPKCGYPRRDADGRPYEECWYFPLRSQLRRLLKLESFRELLMYESRRRSSDDHITDVYDAPRWKSLMGEPTATLKRIALQLCVDAVPPFGHSEQSESVKPMQSMILSLPPALRSNQEYMLLQMLILARLKGQAAKKYYDWAANYEMNDLYGM